MLVGDLDGDATFDLVVEAETSSVVIRGAGGGQFDMHAPLAETGLRGLADIDPDGKLALLTTAGARRGQGDRTFAPRAAGAPGG